MNIKNLTRNPLFYTSLVLAILLGLQMYGFVSAAYIPPPGPPTQGNPVQPLDIGPGSQTKSGSLILGSTLSVGSNLTVSSNATINSTLVVGPTAMPNVKIDPTARALIFSESSNNFGKIYYTGGQLMYQNQDGIPHAIGTGSGGGWSRNTAMNVVYPTTPNDSIYIGNPAVGLTLGNIRSLPSVPASTPTAAAHLVMAVGGGRWWQIGTTINPIGSENLFISTGVSADLSRALTVESGGNLTAEGTIKSKVGGFKFPDNTIQTTAATGGSSAPLSLYQQYSVSAPGGTREKKMISSNSGFCFLTGVKGGFMGAGEGATVEVRSDNFWWLKAFSRRTNSDETLTATARCISNPGGVQIVGRSTTSLFPPSNDYKRVFTTDSGFTADFGGFAGASQKCQEAADTATLGGTWEAWISEGALFTGDTSVVSPATHFTKSTVPYIRLDGIRVADNWTDLVDGYLTAPISITEQNRGITGRDKYNYTNTTPSGERAGIAKNATDNCQNWTSSGMSDTGIGGDIYLTTRDWTQMGQKLPCANPFALYGLYCFEQ